MYYLFPFTTHYYIPQYSRSYDYVLHVLSVSQ